MNRRNVLVNSVAGFGAAAIAGLSSLQATACEGNAAAGKQLIKGQVCPYCPMMFYGSYTLYYGLLVEPDPMNPSNLICKTPKALNGPNSLPLGCGAGGCAASRFDGDRKTGGHPKVKDKGVFRFPSEYVCAADKYLIVNDEVQITCDDPGNPGKEIKVNVRLFKLTIDTKNIDLAHLDDNVAEALKKIDGNRQLFFGHEIEKILKPNTEKPFGDVDNKLTVNEKNGHIVNVKMTKEEELFEVVLHRRVK